MSLNCVTLVGHLGAPPELKTTQNGKTICTFRMATNGPGDGAADWHRVVVWDAQAESCHRYLDTGRLVAVMGRLKSRSYDDSEGKTRWLTEVVANRVAFLGGREDGGGAADRARAFPAQNNEEGDRLPL